MLQSFITPSDDTGSVPAMVIRSRAGSATIVNRPILRIDNYTTPLVTVAANGNVGISTSTPSQTLTVDGILSVTNPGTTAKGSSLSFTSPQGNVGLAYVLGNGTGGTAGRWVTGVDPFNVFYIQRGNLFNSTGVRHLDITADGRIGMGTADSSGAGTTSVPSTTLHVIGSIRMAAETSATYATCNVNRTGAMKYESGDFFYCRNGTAWESLTSLTSGGGSASDRITSGTTQVITRNNTSVSIVTAGVERMVIGTTGNVGIGQQPHATLPFIVSGSGMMLNTYTSDPSESVTLGLTAAIGNVGMGISANHSLYDTPWAPASSVEFAAYGNATMMQFRTSRSGGGTRAPFVFKMGSTEAGGSNPVIEVARITSTGLALGVITPTTRLEVAGRVSATTVQLSNNPADACSAASYGTMKMINGRPYVCRP
ncbi:MAG: hypothetical protein EON60_12960 [Alphaproteobacteria bacterium]|nr:MAG: hypothetical protein EON60_12960 [Alphaproteobacteria bacterium]